MNFDWDDAYNTGNEIIDGQHRMIFDAANMFIDAIQQSKDAAIIDEAFDLLTLYTQTHFADEEKFYAEIGSALQEDQIQQHRELVEQLTKIWDEKEAGSQHAGQALTVWMERHLIPHIIEDDMKAQNSRT